MVRWAVRRVENLGELIRLEILGRPMADYPYQPGEIAIFDTSEEDVKWRPDGSTALVGKTVTWNGERFEIESAYLRGSVSQPGQRQGMLIALKPIVVQAADK